MTRMSGVNIPPILFNVVIFKLYPIFLCLIFANKNAKSTCGEVHSTNLQSTCSFTTSQVNFPFYTHGKQKMFGFLTGYFQEIRKENIGLEWFKK